MRVHRGKSLWEYWLRMVDSDPDRTVLIEALTGVRFSAWDLTQEAFAYAEILKGCPRSVVAFCLPNRMEWMALFLALQKANAGAMPLDASYPKEIQSSVARDLGADFLWKDGKLSPLHPAVRLSRGVCCVKVTSGSTGKPKVVECRASHLIADGGNIIATMGIRPSDLNLSLIPMGHSYGLGNLVMPLILQGTALVCAEAFVPHQVPEWIRAYGVSVFPSVPPVFRVLAETPSIRKLCPLRLAISAGAMLSPDLARMFHRRFGVKIHNFYGSSETGGITYDRTGNATLVGRGIGKPLDGVRVAIRQGRVRVKSAAVAFPNSEWLLPDLGERNRYGELRLLGRADQVANIGGKKVHPMEIESILRTIPGVSDVSVSVLQERGRDYLAAAVESRLEEKDLESVLARRLPPWKLPRRYCVTLRLPRTARGKLDLVKIKQMWVEAPLLIPG